MDDIPIDDFVKSAQSMFIKDLENKITRIYGLLIENEQGCGEGDAREILRFFHTINGTAHTLGLEPLGRIGDTWEARVEQGLREKGGLDRRLLGELYEVVMDIEQRISTISSDSRIKERLPPIDGFRSVEDKGKILLVDDDITILKLLENALMAEGYTVCICDDPEEVLERINFFRPDVIILDVIMPRLDGYELLDKIKARNDLHDASIFFLSVEKDIEDRIKGMRAGADDYITKPFVIEEVIVKIEASLRRKEKQRDKLIRDSLTGVYSGHYFIQRIDEEIERANRYDTTFSIASLTLDNYKAINDKYGHETGDQVLREFASLLSKNIRKCDSVYRRGRGFVILFPDTPKSKARIAFERLQKRIDKEGIRVRTEEIDISYSAGITQIENSGDTALQLIYQADRALYRAKKLGGNRAVVYKEE